MTGAKIGAGAVSGEKVADGSLTGADVNAATLGKVPSAASADHASTAGTATSAGTAASAAKAANAEKLGGSNPSAFGAVLVSSAPISSSEGFYAPVTGAGKSLIEPPVLMTLPNQKMVATDFAVRLEGPAQSGQEIFISLMVDFVPHQVCVMNEVPDVCTPSLTIPVDPAARVDWQVYSNLGTVELEPQFALRLIRG
ncbi:MAG TPA: hypothetical protein VFJ57_11065 [Solirubrobacterales bacterium]|nr:hypothetical protein [Solirubrobacterales bacterium]